MLVSDIAVKIDIFAKVEGGAEVGELAKNLLHIKQVSGELGISMEDLGLKAREALRKLSGIEEIYEFTAPPPELFRTQEEWMAAIAKGYKKIPMYAAGVSYLGAAFEKAEGAIKETGEKLPRWQQDIHDLVGEGSDLANALVSNVQKTREWSAKLGLQRQVLTGVMRGYISGSNAVNYFTEHMGMSKDASEAMIKSHAVLSRSIMTSREGMLRITRALDLWRESGESSVSMWKLMRGEIASMMLQMGMGKREIKDMAGAMKRGYTPAKAAIVDMTVLRERLRGVYEAQRRFRAEMGAAGMALTTMSRSLFWVGLGLMFVMMSYARVRRSQLGVERSTYSLKRAIISQADAQREAQEALADYGRASIEYKNAMLSVEEANWRVIISEESLRGSLEQKWLAYMQLILGAFPTYLRSAIDITNAIMQLSIAKLMSIGLTYQQAQAELWAGNASVVAAVKVGALTISYLKLAVVVGMATAGLSILAGLIGTGMAMGQFDQKMKEVREETDRWTQSNYDLQDSFYGSGVGEAIEKATIASHAFSKELAKLDAPELQTTLDMAPIIPEINVRRKHITVQINNPVVREDKDIDRIARDVSRAITKSSYSRRGKY